MLRIVFIGMEIRILELLKNHPVEIKGVYLPKAPYWVRNFNLLIPKSIFVKWFKTVVINGRMCKFLRKHAIAEIEGTNVNDPGFVKRVKKLNPDLGIVSNFGQILRAPLLDAPFWGFINFHPSLLPCYRGPHPFEEILANNERVSGITWHRMTETIDNGEILLQERFSLDPNDDMQDLNAKAMAAAEKTMGPLLAYINERINVLKAQARV